MSLPQHLKKYVVEQNYSRYTPVDQAAWRYVLRLLVSHLKKHAHPVYESGLAKTGITIDEIPRIEDIGIKLEEFGWKAIPVSGFIPPAAFMEFQSLGYLPIASDMRTLDHVMYTPAPDIVHEAAGHAPIIADPEYASYLKKYADVAAHAIISHEDISLYEAIRELSDIKEDPDSTAENIAQAEEKLTLAKNGLSFVSEAAQLGRMNWWTAEYGLIGDLEDPKIFGAGLLSSPGESRSCLDPSVKKIPLSVSCIEQDYDITEKQPQLFVARDFQHLCDVLEEMAAGMAFRRGGRYGLNKALEAQTVNTVELSSGLQISGKLIRVIEEGDQPVYLQFQGPSQLSMNRTQIPGHGVDFHSEGYGTALGPLKTSITSLEVDQEVKVEFSSGVLIQGKLVKKTSEILSFDQCRVTHKEEVLFEPEWGIYDLSLGESVTSVFGGPADREAFGETDSFTASFIPLKEHSETEKKRHELYQKIRNLREECLKASSAEPLEQEIQNLLSASAEEWLAPLEIKEILLHFSSQTHLDSVDKQLVEVSQSDPKIKRRIDNGLKAAADMPLLGL